MDTDTRCTTDFNKTNSSNCISQLMSCSTWNQRTSSRLCIIWLFAHCERGCVHKSVKLLIRESAQGTSLRSDPHGRWGWSWRSGERTWRWERRWREQSGESKSIKTTTPCGWYMRWLSRNTPWAMSCALSWVQGNNEKRWRVRVCCSHSPSVAADCHQLLTIWLQPFKKCQNSLSE